MRGKNLNVSEELLVRVTFNEGRVSFNVDFYVQHVTDVSGNAFLHSPKTIT